MLTLRLVKGRNRTILYQEKPYFVAFPDLVFELGYSGFFENGETAILSFRDLRVRLPSSERVPLLPNIEQFGKVCLRNFVYDESVSEGDNKEKILFDKVLDRFWTTSFTSHFYMVDVRYRNRYIDVFETCLKKGQIRSFDLLGPHAY